MEITAEKARELTKQSYETNKLLMVPYIEIIKNMIKVEAEFGKWYICVNISRNKKLPYAYKLNGYSEILKNALELLGFNIIVNFSSCYGIIFAISWYDKVLEEAMKS